MSQHGCPERLSNRSKGFQEDGPQPTMEVLVETLTGTAFEMTVSPSDTIFAIKSKICRVEGIPVSQQHLVYNLRELEDAMSLGALGIAAGARLRLVLGLRGGPVSTRRLPPPPPRAGSADPWRDIERLLDSNRDDGDWGCGGGGSGCRVTVVVFRDGERVNMLRVRENADGSYSPATPPLSEHHNCNYSSPLAQVSERESEDGAGAGAGGGGGALTQNAVTMGKMVELRRRMESLSLRRHAPEDEKPEIQKTRSEETLSVPSLLDDPDPFGRSYTPYSEAEDSFAPLYEGHYTRYEYECTFGDRYTLLPPLSARGDEPATQDADNDRLKLSDALAGSILVQGRREARDEAAILEECLDGADRQESPPLAANIPAAEYGPLVGGESTGWRARGFGSSSQLSRLAGGGGGGGGGGRLPPPHARSASSLHVRPPPPARAPPLADALFSSSTSDLEQLTRNRLLPALSRHRNTEHLHLSDEHLLLAPRPAPTPTPTPTPTPAPALEVGRERRQRRIEKIAELENSRLFRFGDFEDGKKQEIKHTDQKESSQTESKEYKEKKIRIRCGFCRKKLSIATVHKCRCGAEFCAPHRYAEVHGCAYDYKANAHQYLQRANPLVSAPKLPKI